MFASRLSYSQLSKNNAFPASKENARSTLYLRNSHSASRLRLWKSQGNCIGAVPAVQNGRAARAPSVVFGQCRWGLGQRPNLKSPCRVLIDRACVVRSKGGVVTEPILRSVGVRDKMERASWDMECGESSRCAQFKNYAWLRVATLRNFWYISANIELRGRRLSFPKPKC